MSFTRQLITLDIMLSATTGYMRQVISGFEKKDHLSQLANVVYKVIGHYKLKFNEKLSNT